MKRVVILPALALAAALSLTGCAAMLERSHVSSTTHMDYAVEADDESILRAETYQGLVNSLRYFIDEHRSGGVVRLYNYTGDVETDLATARDEVLQDPVGAFAVGGLNYDSTRILTYYEVKLTISYTRTAREVEAIPEVFGLSGVQQELNRLVAERQASAVFMATYFSGDWGLMEDLFVESVYNAPELFRYPAGPEAELNCEIRLYPETGTRRIVEVRVSWPDSDQEAARRVEELERTASALLEDNPPAGEGYTVEELAAIVRSAHGGEDAQGSSLPRDVLSGEAASDLGLLMTMEYLCRQCGVDSVMVWGEGPRQNWLIVSTPDGYRHLLVDSLYADPEEDPDGEDPDGEDPDGEDPSAEGPDAEEPELPFALYTDRELAGMGYKWPTSLYPVCEEPGPLIEAELS